MEGSQLNREGPGDAAVVTLLVTDDDVLRAHLRACLEVQGCTVLESRCGLEALQMSGGREMNVRLLLTDVVLPDMSGRELAEALRAARPGVKVILMSAYPGAYLLENGFLSEDGALLRKPFTLAALLYEVRRALGR